MTSYDKIKTLQKLNIHLYYCILTRLQLNNCTPTTHLWHGLHCRSGMWAIATHCSTKRNVLMSANLIKLTHKIISMLNTNSEHPACFWPWLIHYTNSKLAYFTLRCSGMLHRAVQYRVLPPMNAWPHNHSSTNKPWENLNPIQGFGPLSFSWSF
jgi:hypothetical protein